MWRHDLDPLPLMAGIIFTAWGIAALAGGIHVPADWAGPVLLIVAGIVGLVASRPRQQQQLGSDPTSSRSTRTTRIDAE